MVRGSSPRSPGQRLFVNFFALLFYDVCVLSPALRDICHVSMAHYSLFVLKVALNTDLIN